jgi:hypothetical protein
MLTPIMPSFVPNAVAQKILLWIYTPKRSGPGIDFDPNSRMENGYVMNAPGSIPHGE